MKPSRKERKQLADIKRLEYLLIIAEEAERLVKPRPFNQHWVLALDIFIRDMVKSNHLDAHLIIQSAKEWQRRVLENAMKGGTTHATTS